MGTQEDGGTTCNCAGTTKGGLIREDIDKTRDKSGFGTIMFQADVMLQAGERSN